MTGIDPTDLTTIDSAPNIGELLQTLIWCSVVEQDPSVTMEQVRSAMTLRSMLGLLGAYRTPVPSIAPVGNN